MRKVMKGVAGFALAAGLVMTAGGTNAQASGSTYEGCPYGYVCVYPGSNWNGGVPSLKYYTYGVHDLYNQYGTHRVFNNQSGGAIARLCKNSDGTNCVFTLNSWTYVDYDLTPINAIDLAP